MNFKFTNLNHLFNFQIAPQLEEMEVELGNTGEL